MPEFYLLRDRNRVAKIKHTDMDVVSIGEIGVRTFKDLVKHVMGCSGKQAERLISAGAVVLYSPLRNI